MSKASQSLVFLDAAVEWNCVEIIGVLTDALKEGSTLKKIRLRGATEIELGRLGFDGFVKDCKGRGIELELDTSSYDRLWIL